MKLERKNVNRTGAQKMIPLRKIASHINGHLIGNEDIGIRGISSIKDAREGEITFLTHPGYKKYLKDCRASAIIVGKDFPVDTLKNIHIIVADHPASAYIKTFQLFIKPRKRKVGSSKLALLSKQSRIAKDVSIAPYVFVDKKAAIKSGVTIYPFVYIGENVIIDEGSTIYPHVTIYDNVTIGKNVTIHSGTVIARSNDN
jgi:UDP-3-O-[3-hydroxymyristoyl] glucosamine N-acyltransferase